ncbi:hypothetical protein [Cupriavidus sp. WS]|uniref:hypothetical protein n=1 Tax=Cupriavidus sp. WS TaxID=1312922 RepID=UPI00037F69BE|nr:hypothetical protein [Cupriavidus sp. WS]
MHPVDARLITVQAYLAEFGMAALHGGAPHPRCPLCHRALLLIGARSTQIRPRFSHGSRARARCPLMRHGDLPEELVMGEMTDVGLARAQRDAYLARWQWHLTLMRRPELVPSMTIGRFLGLAELAAQRGVWGYAGLNPALVPYIQLALAGFLPGERGYRSGGSWIRFWFDAPVRGIADLHVPRDPAPRFYRAHYVRPRDARAPQQQHLYHLDEVKLDAAFLSGPPPRVDAAEVQACWAWLPGQRS